MERVSIALSWAISQYREAAAVARSLTRGAIRSVRAPSESPEVTAYFRAVGIGRNIDFYV